MDGVATEKHVFSYSPVHHAAYRGDIDGLRAIAVLAVVTYHAFPGAAAGGFTGVDIFFVISGYLISGILYRQNERDCFSYRDFYGRRIRRIYPALIIVLVCTLAVFHQELFLSAFTRMARNAFGATLFIANLMFWQEAGYFDASADTKPLLHLWSLGIEEQYYILWPVIVALTYRRRRIFLALLAALFTTSFLANISLSGGAPDSAFYLPWPRFWELLVGSIVALQTHRDRGLLPANMTAGTNALSVLGIVLVTASVLHPRAIGFPGWWALGPTLGAAAILAAGPATFINRRLLALPPLAFVGRISYPLYLWHWPILVLLRVEVGQPSRASRVIALGLSLALAWLTYRLVEMPLRWGGRERKKTLILVTGMAVVGICAATLAWVPRAPDPRDGFVASFENIWPDYAYGHRIGLFASWREECNSFDYVNRVTRDAIDSTCITPIGASSVLLWGDSHAQQLAPGLAGKLPPDVSLLQVATSSCIPSLSDPSSDSMSPCTRSNRIARETIARAHPEVVILAQHVGHLATDWPELIAGIRGLGAGAVIVVGPDPQWDRDLPLLIARQYWPTPPDRLLTGFSTAVAAIDQKLRDIVAPIPGAHFVSLSNGLCDVNGCLAYVGPDRVRDLVSFDQSHLTPAGSANVVARLLLPVLLPLLTPQHLPHP